MDKRNKQLSNPSSTGDVGGNFETESDKNKVKNRFGLIQLSDLQFGKKHIFGDPSKIAEKLLSDIKKMSGKGEYNFTPLYIVLSGDITEAAHEKEFNDAANVIEEILNGLNIVRTNILCVPGNHDVNWNKSKKGNDVGDNQLKFQPYNEFVANITQSDHGTVGVTYPLIKGDEWNIEFLLLNSCEKIDHENTYAWICQEKLKGSLASKKEKESLRIVIAHHSLHSLAEDEFREVLKTEDPIIPKQLLQKHLKAVENMKEVISLIEYHKCDIVLTGHIHNGQIKAPTDDEGHPIIYSGCGSTGVNKDQREDGIQNQYSIHVIDCDTFKFQSIWRAYNPSIRTENGRGGWIEDGSFNTNPTEYSLPPIKRNRPITPETRIDAPLSSMADTVSKLTDSGAEEKPKDVNIKPSETVATNLDKMKIAIANLLGGWNENA